MENKNEETSVKSKKTFWRIGEIVVLFLIVSVISVLCFFYNAKQNNEQFAVETIMIGNVKLEMIKVEAGTFMMGSPVGEEGREDDEKQHKVTLTKDYWLGKYEVTQDQYQAIMGNNPSHFKGARRPVEQVSWDDAMAFCKKINELTIWKRPAGYEYSLPTEAQWEYAARGGNKSQGYIYSGSNNLNRVGWYESNSILAEWTIKNYLRNIYIKYLSNRNVGNKKPNELGLHDMSGNVWEWCHDWYGPYDETEIDPRGTESAFLRVFRGGSWYNIKQFSRSSNRENYTPSFRGSSIGFRVALIPVQ